MPKKKKISEKNDIFGFTKSTSSVVKKGLEVKSGVTDMQKTVQNGIKKKPFTPFKDFEGIKD